MNAYEYSVTKEMTDKNNLASVPSIYANIINAIIQNLKKEGYDPEKMKASGQDWLILRSAVEISERPRLDENYNILVWNSKGKGLTYYKCVRITDKEGNEIGCGTTEWCVIDLKTKRPIFPELKISYEDYTVTCRNARRINEITPEIVDHEQAKHYEHDVENRHGNVYFVKMFYNLLPKELLSSGLSIRIEMNYKEKINNGETISYGIKKEKNDEYKFIACNDGKTLCTGALTTE